MMKWQEIVKSVAPILGTALGGPMAGAAIKVLSGQILGDENASADALESAILSASPNQLVEIKRLDYQFKIDMQKLGVDVFELEVKDRSNARQAHKDSITPTIMLYLLTTMVSGILYALFSLDVPTDNKSILYMVVGQVITAWIAAVAYWYGTTKSSSDKSKMLTGLNKL
jgi:hypothetical protein